MSKVMISVTANKAFLLSEGSLLRAHSLTVIAIPAEILREGAALSSIIELSNDDTRIAFKEAAKSSDGFVAILIELHSGETLRLNRSTEAIAVGSASEEFVFDVEN